MTTVQSKDGPEISFEASGVGLALVLVNGALCCRGSGANSATKAVALTTRRRQSWEASFDNLDRVLAA
jgi:hypothetical protein